MNEKIFDPNKLQKLNNPQRFLDIPPEYVWGKLNLEKPDILVEIGAGTAFFSIAFLQHFKPSTIYACDLSEVMINWVKENVSPKYPSIIPVKSEEHSVPLDDRIADLVFMIGQVCKRTVVIDIFHVAIAVCVKFMKNRIMDPIELEGFYVKILA